MDLKPLIYVFFGILPSSAWLSYYLRKDIHPEPKKSILRIFLWGAAITLPVFFVQIGLATLLNKIDLPPVLTSVIYWFLVISFTEEIFKYLVVKAKVTTSSDLDEPLDIMLYMVIAALGFAALENILYLFAPIDQLSFNDMINRTLIITFIRFIGATFLHTLCSALIGYFMAISFCEKKTSYIFGGIILATVLHGLYDFSIMTLDGYAKVALPAFVIITLAFMVFWGFESLKKLKSICKIN